MKYFSVILLFLFVYSSYSFCQSSGPGPGDDLTKVGELIEDKRYAEAEVILEKLISKNKKRADLHYSLSLIFFYENKIGEAEKEAELAVNLGGYGADYHCLLGLCYERDVKTADTTRQVFLRRKIKEEFLTAIASNPRDVRSRFELAQYYFATPDSLGGNENKAIEQANIVLKLNEIQGRFLLARIYFHQRRYDLTEVQCSILEKKIDDDPNYYVFYNYYGYVLLYQGKIDTAIEKFRKQVALAPNDANAHDSLGEGLLKKGLLEESLAEYNRALEIDPNFKNAGEKVRQIKKMIERGEKN